MPDLFGIGAATASTSRLESDIQARVLAIDPVRVAAIVDDLARTAQALRIVAEFIARNVKETP